jgi:SAM-dependent methyltransferase
MKTPPGTLNLYQIVKDDYDNLESSYQISYNPTIEYRQQIDSFVNQVIKSDSMLLVGGITSEYKYFSEKGFDVTAVDISNFMLRLMTQKNHGAVTINENIKDFFPGKTYAGVWECRSLIHIPPSDINETLDHIRGLLSPKGIFGSIFFTSTSTSIEEQKLKEEHTKAENIWYYRVLYPKDMLQEIFEETKWNITKIEECFDADREKGIYIEASP